MLTIIDYGLGNILSFQNVYKRINIETRIAKSVDDLTDASKLILPGVGAFDHAIDLLNESGMRNKIEELVFERKIPIVGICVGMQILANSSEEGVKPGLGWIPGRVKKFNFNKLEKKYPMPHMGWNDVLPNANGFPLFRGLESDSRFYFLHSYYFECEDSNHEISRTEYGTSFSSSVNRGHIFGVQFHPEKSHHYGQILLKNFAEL
ncbi:imidazole glycerol phosphate synthase subunit HisH [Leptospira perdikensis]|uniref:Imidazole glycerol phosphate synthase subunit HisH n=1 Tax=Leptospira perdikensis TaxID=2484948 RepID=A0A4R9JDW5_9LEPT|nr:imidazole glycerol phosphate synthase subunit HisH [Leptospira perdikensis]TGL37114.1 imidazole glycerol phosphate synthase subunit HisH [Leptospira perdikensis]